MPDAASAPIHASCVALNGRAALITGASGSGKSGLALQMMALGCDLVADDKVVLTAVTGAVTANAPAAIIGMIEARGIGILNATPVEDAQIVLIVDLDHVEKNRLPPARHRDVMGQSVPLLHKVETPYFASALVQYLRAGKAPV